jgi:hypothetical protein
MAVGLQGCGGGDNPTAPTPTPVFDGQPNPWDSSDCSNVVKVSGPRPGKTRGFCILLDRFLEAGCAICRVRTRHRPGRRHGGPGPPISATEARAEAEAPFARDRTNGGAKNAGSNIGSWLISTRRNPRHPPWISPPEADGRTRPMRLAMPSPSWRRASRLPPTSCS